MIRTRFAAACCLVAATGLLSGCALREKLWTADRWVADFDSAERCVRNTGRELLICYTASGRAGDPAMVRTLKSEPIKSKIAGRVRCTLSRAYEPDRRYVAQYGVTQAPALIIVHADGTYHARTGPLTSSEIEDFLAAARPPGKPPTVNRNIVRRADYDWHKSLDEALLAGKKSDRPVLIVYYRRWSGDWHRLKRILSRHEVYSRLEDMVACRVGLRPLSAPRAATAFGTLALPALVIARPDGTHHALELPVSYESVVKFAETARTRRRDVGTQ